MKRKKNQKKAKTKNRQPFVLKLYQVRSNSWASYDLPDCKIEVMQIQGNWIAAATLDNAYSSSLVEIARDKTKALIALLATPGVPNQLNLSASSLTNLYEHFGNIDFYWQDEYGQFKKENYISYLKPQDLELTFYERTDGSWISYFERLCKFELVHIDDKWLASVTPLYSISELVKYPFAFDKNRDSALYRLLEIPDIHREFGLTLDSGKNLKYMREKVTIRWQSQKTKVSKDQLQREQGKTETSRLRCRWFGHIKECDNSGGCGFCASSGWAYFIRSDD